MRNPVATAIAIGVGLVLLLGYFLAIPVLVQIRTVLLDWAVILAGVAGLIAIANLIGVHWRKVSAARNRDYYSVILIVAFALTLAAGLVLQPSHTLFQHIVNDIQRPIEASLMAVVGISLALAGFRLFQRRKGLLAIVFIFSALVFLVVGSGLLMGLSTVPVMPGILAFLNRLPLAGARGILLGVALGSLITGLRVLVGADRPYSG